VITYTVKYKDKDSSFWSKLKKVKGDGIVENNSHRFFILEDETRIEIPLYYSFKFSKERFFCIKERMESEAKQEIKLDKK